MKKVYLSILAALAVAPAVSQAQAFQVPSPTYTHIQGYYHNQKLSDTDAQFKGPGVLLEYQVSNGLFVTGEYRQGSDTLLDVSTKLKDWSVGVGTFHQVNRQTTLDLILTGGQNSLTGLANTSVGYYALQGGIRRRMTEFFEVGVSYRFIDYQESGVENDNSFGANVTYHVDPDFGFNLSFRNFDYGNLVSAGVSYKF